MPNLSHAVGNPDKFAIGFPPAREQSKFALCHPETEARGEGSTSIYVSLGEPETNWLRPPQPIETESGLASAQTEARWKLIVPDRSFVNPVVCVLDIQFDDLQMQIDGVSERNPELRFYGDTSS